MEFLRILFSPFGRIGRAAYWLATALKWVAFIALLQLASAVSPTGGRQVSLAEFKAHLAANLLWELFFLSIMLQFFWLGFAISVKRWHDRGKSGFWVLVNLIPLIGPLWQFVECGLLPGAPGGNAYGAPQSDRTPRQTADVFS